ncbi:hypothetical protein GCM10010862_23170 [Devosia nitrariae]|uniref:FAD-dependent oxidoreductase n=1 Tax=Devosia nitrariae TaxID=2071872 RepID=A0ABQ5W5L9_9HYPH|nr:hypothetical protein GCM10010862_23170 [Devosia nitrariae]
MRFRLNGHLVEGFAGDTVLSAAVASGFAEHGTLAGSPIALTTAFAPPVAETADPGHALPMARVPAIDNLDLVTLPAGPAGDTAAARLRRILQGPPRSLGIRLDTTALPPGTSAMEAGEVRAADVVIVGGGVAGMTAAVAAARMDRSVVLVERRPMLGGNAMLFGRTEGEEAPEDAIARLTSEITALANIAVLVASEVVALNGRRLRIHSVLQDKGHAKETIREIEASHVVLATGTLERLPLFTGNRLPGVVGTMEAFHLAHAYGVWPDRSAAFATVSNAAYRLAVLAADAGIGVRRIVDHRPQPQSRFIEFCKAYGITMAGGVMPLAATLSGRGAPGLSVRTAVSIEGYEREEEPLHAQRLIVCGGWQPDLTLWHMGGGLSGWQAEQSRLVAGDGPPHLALAGAAAGYLGTQACLDSGGEAVARCFGQPVPHLHETLIDPAYETPDAPATIASIPAKAAAPCYLDGGESLTALPATPRAPILGKLGLARHTPTWNLAEQSRALSIADVAAGVALGAIPSESAGEVARERAIDRGAFFERERETGTAGEDLPPPLVPDYLNARYGPNATVWLVQSLETRRLDTGSLIFVNSDQANPVHAIGVVLTPLPEARGQALALIGKVGATPGEGATLRDQNRPVPIRLVRPHDANANAVANEPA